MGLSSEERRSGIFNAIRGIVDRARNLSNDPGYENVRIKKLAEQLWPAFLGNQCNGIHWLIGSSAGNSVKGENYTPWDTSIAAHIEGVIAQTEVDECGVTHCFDPLLTFLNIPGLLKNSHRRVMEIFICTEDLAYYLRRYTDGFLKSYKQLSDLCARIQGECFSVFADNQEFAYAYLGTQICDVVYHSFYFVDGMDTVTQFLIDSNLHHDIGCSIRDCEVPLKRLTEMHTELRRIKHSSRCSYKNQVRRLLIALELAGRHFHYGHQHVALTDLLKKAEWPKEDLGRVEAALLKFCQERKEDKKEFVDELFYANYGDIKYEESE